MFLVLQRPAISWTFGLWTCFPCPAAVHIYSICCAVALIATQHQIFVVHPCTRWLIYVCGRFTPNFFSSDRRSFFHSLASSLRRDRLESRPRHCVHIMRSCRAQDVQFSVGLAKILGTKMALLPWWWIHGCTSCVHRNILVVGARC